MLGYRIPVPWGIKQTIFTEVHAVMMASNSLEAPGGQGISDAAL